MKRRIGLSAALCLFFTACGYHAGGRSTLIPPDVKTIAIPIFKNQTPQYRIEQQMTAAVTREFIERTRFRVTQNPAAADALLTGTITGIRQGVVTFNPETGGANTLQITVSASVALTDLHSKKAIFSNPNYVFRGQYQVSPSASKLIEEDPAAINRMSGDFARALVTDIIENF
ncbi:MAG: LptE family protein [Acidobacteriota bacterium]|nr:LptE family protein [Acidobacteriota bacterium]